MDLTRSVVDFASDRGEVFRVGRDVGLRWHGDRVLDFLIFGTATALVFGGVFFSSCGGRWGLVALGATFAAALVAHSVGAVLFGHVGDRLGRKRTLVTTLTVMGAQNPM